MIYYSYNDLKLWLTKKEFNLNFLATDPENFPTSSETPRVKTRGISRYKLRLPYVLHNVSYSPKT